MLKKSELEELMTNDLSDLWSVLQPEEKRIVADNMTITQFKHNQVIYPEGANPEFLWVLLRGKVKKYKRGVGDRPQILRLYRPVQYFGYRAYFANEKYVSSAMAVEDSTLGFIPMDIVDRLIHENIKLAMFFIYDLSRNLGGSDTKLVNLTQKHIRGRLAEALLLLLDSYGLEEDNLTLKIYLSRDDLASLCNMTTSNAIRTLTAFVSENLIVVDGRKIKITNEEQLRKISSYG